MRYYILGFLVGVPLVIIALLVLGNGKWTPTGFDRPANKITFYFAADCQSLAGSPEVDVTSSNSQVRPPQAWKSFRVGYGGFALHGGEYFGRPRWPTCDGWYSGHTSACINIPDDFGPVRGVSFLHIGARAAWPCGDVVAKCNSGDTSACHYMVTACAMFGIEVVDNIARAKTCR